MSNATIRWGFIIAGVLAIGLAAAEFRGQNRVHASVAAAAPQLPARQADPLGGTLPKPASNSPTAPSPTNKSPAPLAAGATAVPDESLLKLSDLVGMDDVWNREPDRASWAKAIPVAEKLLQGPCDCEQRNWLKHFVEMGDSAVSGDDKAYYELARVMSQLSRNDSQALAAGRRPK